MTPLQIIVLFFAIFAFSRTLLRWRDSKITTSEFTFWTTIWIALIVIVFQPKITDIISRQFGITRGIDFFVYITIVLLLYLIFRLYVKIETIEQDITKITSAIAMQHPKKKK